MNRKLDDIVSLLLAISVTLLFIGQTIANWPDLARLDRFRLEHDNPFAALHISNTVTALNSEDN